MKLSRASTILSITALCALLSFNPLKVHADAFLNMQLTGVQGASYGNESVYPYYGTANGISVTLMCISFTADMSIGETWVAEDVYLPLTPEYEEAAWLFTDANTAVAGYNAAIAAANAATLAGETAIAASETAIAAGYTAQQIADQWAAWELFSADAYGSPAPGADTQMAKAVANYASEPASFYEGFILYVPQAGSQNKNGTAQYFLGYHAETPDIPPDLLPEPGSLVLLGSGLLGLAGLIYRKKYIA